MRGIILYASSLPKILSYLDRGDYSSADHMVNNIYYSERRTAADFITLLRLTANHRAFKEATDGTHNQLAQILFHLDRKHNNPYNELYVAYKPTIVSGVKVRLFTIVEKGSTPAR